MGDVMQRPKITNTVVCSPKNYTEAKVLEYMGFEVMEIIHCPDHIIYVFDEDGELHSIVLKS